MTMITPSYLGETIEYSSLHACRSTLEDPTGLFPEILEVPFLHFIEELVIRGWSQWRAGGRLRSRLRSLRPGQERKHFQVEYAPQADAAGA